MKEKALYFPFLFLLFVIIAAEVFIAPVGNFALNDDWAYARSVHVLNSTGSFEIGIWPGMSLFSHVLLGVSFVKVFGFSYTVLRFANMALSLVTLFFVYRLFLRSQKPLMAMFLCALIFFNPFYMNLFNSFMTDLSFFNFSFLAFYALTCYYQKSSKVYLFLFFVLSVLATLTRQLGIILFASYFMAALVDLFQRRSVKELLNSMIIGAFGLMILYVFEKYMSYKLTPDSAYQGVFISPKNIPLGSGVLGRIIDKAIHIVRNSGSIFLILFVMFLPGLFRRVKDAPYLQWILLFGLCVHFFFSIPHKEIVGDVLINFGLGLESTVDIAYLAQNTQSNAHLLYHGLQLLFIAGALLFLLFMSSFKLKTVLEIKPVNVFLIFLCFFYLISIGVAESSFDRYCLFFMLFATIALAEHLKLTAVYTRISAMVLLLIIATFSVLATKDYVDAAKLKLKIRQELLSTGNLTENDINTGFEHELWDGSLNELNWIKWDHYKDRKFVLTRGPLEGFRVNRTYSYNKYLPPRVSTFYLLERSDSLQTH